MSWHNDSAILHHNQREDDLVWDNDDRIYDDAILHFDPDERDRPLPRKPSPPLNTLARVDTPPTNVNPLPTTPQDRVVRGNERKIGKPRSRKQKVDAQSNNPTQHTEVDDVELKSRMLDAIREDDELYHRILRYDVGLHSYTPETLKRLNTRYSPFLLRTS